MRAQLGKDLIRCLVYQAVDGFLGFDFGLRDWTKIARALHTAGDVAEVLSHKDGMEKHIRKLKKRAEKEREEAARKREAL